VIPEIGAKSSVTLTYTAELIASPGLETGEVVENVAAVPTYFGLPKAEREAPEAEFRTYEGPTKSKQFEIEDPQLVLEKTAGTGGPGGNVATVGVAFRRSPKTRPSSTRCRRIGPTSRAAAKSAVPNRRPTKGTPAGGRPSPGT
jgi:hypothetical protein